MVIGLMLLIVMIGCIYGYCKSHSFDTLFGALSWITGIIGCLLFAISIISYFISAETVTRMQAFYYDTTKAYEEVIKEYPDAVEITTSQGSVTLKQVPVMMLERIESYNLNLAFYRRWQDHWFVGDFISWIPDDLKPMHTIKPNTN